MSEASPLIRTRSKNPSRIRLRDIAAKAGVSIMTVSKALRDEPDVAVTTRERLRNIASSLGYVPDTAAQSMRNNSTRLLGLVVPSTTNPFFARLIVGLEEKAHAFNYDLILAHSHNQSEREEAVIRRLLARRIDGLFVAPVYRLVANAPIYEMLSRRAVPTVVLGHRALFCAQFSSVETEDIAASYRGTKHLLELGHKRIAFFTGPVISPQAQERYEGYRRALREAGLEPDDRLVFNAGSTLEEGEKAALQFLNERSDATAIQAVNDLVAIGAASQLIQQGLRIPADISILGFGNILLSEQFKVPLTTIHQPKHSLGVAAMDAMLRVMEGQPAETKRLPCELISRASTAPVTRPPNS